MKHGVGCAAGLPAKQQDMGRTDGNQTMPVPRCGCFPCVARDLHWHPRAQRRHKQPRVCRETVVRAETTVHDHVLDLCIGRRQRASSVTETGAGIKPGSQGGFGWRHCRPDAGEWVEQIRVGVQSRWDCTGTHGQAGGRSLCERCDDTAKHNHTRGRGNGTVTVARRRSCRCAIDRHLGHTLPSQAQRYRAHTRLPDKAHQSCMP